ncbi:NTP pyrophosphohydrolase, partial [Streptomyces niveus]
MRILLIVDGANVVGSVPDGWWRDRRAAAERLRERLVPLAVDGLPGAGIP